MGIGGNWRRSSRFKWVLFWVTTGMGAVMIFVVMSLYDFLAVNHPVGEGVLVVEAWIPAQTLAESPRVFHSGHYRYLVVVDGEFQASGSESNDPVTYDDLAAERLEKLGFDTKKLVKISAPTVSTGRTFARATAVKRWLGNSETSVCCVDVFTVGVHARKSWILFRHALGDRYQVGIISGTPVSYHRRSWFFSTTGIRLVVRNLAGYIYFKFLILFDRNASSSISQYGSRQNLPTHIYWEACAAHRKYADGSNRHEVHPLLA